MAGNLHPQNDAPLGDVATERLELRAFRSSDLDELAHVFAKEAVWQFPHGRAFTRGETEDFLTRQLDEWERLGFGCWAAIHRADARMIGFVGLSVPEFLPEVLPAVEVGWRLDSDYWGRGLATEGAAAALLEGFTTLGLAEIISIPQTGNLRSSQVCERLGMRFDRKVVVPANDRRGELDAMIYRLARTA